MPQFAVGRVERTSEDIRTLDIFRTIPELVLDGSHRLGGGVESFAKGVRRSVESRCEVYQFSASLDNEVHEG